MLPLVVPSAGLDLSPVWPVDEMEAAAASGGARLAALHAAWIAASGGPPPTPLTGWLAAREAEFDAAGWDFSAASLPALEELVRREPDAFERACWYFGEVLRRGLGGYWEEDGATRFLLQVGPRRGKIIPSLVLSAALREPGETGRRWALEAGTRSTN